MKSTPLIFFGSGPVALASLRAIAPYFDIEMVVTKPKSPQQRDEPIVITWAKAQNLPIAEVGSRQELDSYFSTFKPKSTVGLVVDFGIIISPQVISAFPLGIINSHFSLLPKLRGADPISFAILEGLSETGVSLMKIVPALDEGPLLLQEKIQISTTDTTPSLTDKLVALSSELLISALPKYITGDIIPVEQDVTTEPSYTRKLTKNDSIVDWSKPASQLAREVRAFQGWPKSRAKIADYEVILLDTLPVTESGPTGEVIPYRDKLVIGCGSGSLQINKLTVPGKKPMSGHAFILGYL